MIGDRRRPVARYVQFRDEATQQRFILGAEGCYRRLLKTDLWRGETAVELPTEGTVTQRRGLRRRAEAVPTPPPTVVRSAALATASAAATRVPPRIAAIEGCAAGRGVARAIAAVLADLVEDLTPLPATEQRAHPAYTQTLRLAAELEAFADVAAAVGCQDPTGCVGLRAPEHWGRRVEDVEVAEVRSVLVQLADKAALGD